MTFNSLIKNRYTWPLAALALILLTNAFISPDAFSLEIKDGRLYGGLVDILNRSVPVALLAMGMALVIATGGIDLSVGAIIAITGAVCAALLTGGVTNPVWVVAVGLGAGLLAGAVNGGLVGLLGIQPIVATLILMVAGRGIAQLINGGQIITFHNDGFADLGVGTVAGLPAPVFIALMIFTALQLLVRKTALGLFIEAVGCNATASHYAGLNVKSIQWSVYCISGLCAAVAGIVITADIQGADANNAGLWLELDAILAVVVGGASLAGGRFSLPLTLIGVLIIQSLSTTIITSGIEPKYNLLIKSLVIITILLLQSQRIQQQFRACFSRIAQGARPQ